jgi:hypothetical protein
VNTVRDYLEFRNEDVEHLVVERVQSFRSVEYKRTCRVGRLKYNGGLHESNFNISGEIGIVVDNELRLEVGSARQGRTRT